MGQTQGRNELSRRAAGRSESFVLSPPVSGGFGLFSSTGETCTDEPTTTYTGNRRIYQAGNLVEDSGIGPKGSLSLVGQFLTRALELDVYPTDTFRPNNSNNLVTL